MENLEYDLSKGKSSELFLKSLNMIFTFDRRQISRTINREILKNIILVIKKTNDISIVHECLNLFLKSDYISEIDFIVDYLSTTYVEKFGSFKSHNILDFGTNSLDFCIVFLKCLTIKITQIPENKRDLLEEIWNNLIVSINQKIK